MRDNTALIERVREGDKQAENRMVEENMGLVYSIARRFLNRGYDAEDLTQIGAIGLIKAVKKFNPEFNVQFSTYAVPMITGEIKRFLRDDGAVKISRTLKENAMKGWRCEELLRRKLNRQPTINEISKELPPVKADFEKLTLVFNNILNNAFKYTDEGDLIRLNAIEEENFIKISIQDTGLGISEENLKQLFQSDFRHSDDNIEYRGSGLGLYLSGQIINAHHGTIRAVSQPGKGSTFVFTIPTFKEETNT